MAIVSFNERDLLAACLGSLQADADEGRAEVWVVDNASSDGSAEMVRERFPWVRLIASEENLGYGPAVNRVASRTVAAFIAPANQDIELEPGALGRMVATARERPDVGAVAPRLVGDDGAVQHSVHPFPTVGLTLFFNLGLQHVSRRLADRLCLAGSWDPSRSRAVPWALGAFLLVRREAFEAAGRFDDAMWMYAEDLDLAWRLRDAGFSTYYESAAVVRHRGSVSTQKAFGGEVEARFMAASYDWMRRRRGHASTLAVASVNMLGSGVRALGLRIAARLWSSRYRASYDRMAGWTRVHADGLRRRD